MLTTCPHCGTRSPASADACAGCDRALYPLTAPPPPPPFKFRTRTNYVRLGITLGVVALLVGAGTSSGMLMNRDDDTRNNQADKEVSQYKMVDTGATPDPSPTSASPSPQVKKKKKAVTASPSPTPSKTSTSAPPEPEPTEKPKPPARTLPAGFHTVVDDRGFSLAVMEGWQRQELSPTQVGFVPPTNDQYLHVSQVENAPRASFINFLETEQALAESGNGYQRILLEHRTFQGHPAARWEFTYVPESGDPMHVVEQAYIDDAGTEYNLYFEAPQRLWDDQKELVFSTALNTFKQP
ncbi:hypothetical protein K378_05457 [Streptomyces sp. Amel2xB2]|nr:hypothetical protein K378_05457 [Streptomyces sp. Amel2xB2]